MKSPSIVLNQAKTFIKEAQKELAYWLFPSFCLHCKREETKDSELFCSLCRQWVQRACLSECSKNKAVAVEREGVALTLLNHRSGSRSSEVLETMASFMVLQWIDLQWPLPTLLLPVPKDPAAFSLAERLSAFLGVPAKKWLKSEWERKQKHPLSDEIVLLVELEMDESCQILTVEEAAPFQIFSLGFCKK